MCTPLPSLDYCYGVLKQLSDSSRQRKSCVWTEQLKRYECLEAWKKMWSWKRARRDFSLRADSINLIFYRQNSVSTRSWYGFWHRKSLTLTPVHVDRRSIQTRIRKALLENVALLVPNPFPLPLVSHQFACLLPFTKIMIAILLSNARQMQAFVYNIDRITLVCLKIIQHWSCQTYSYWCCRLLLSKICHENT